MEGLEYAPGFPRALLAHSLPVEEALQTAGALLLGGGGLWACLEGPPWGWGCVEQEGDHLVKCGLLSSCLEMELLLLEMVNLRV